MNHTEHTLIVNDRIRIPLDQIEMTQIRAQGAGGQNVNKVSSAIHLRFDIHAASLPQAVKDKLLNSNDNRITREGVLVIKAQQFRTHEKNREDALERLAEIIRQAAIVQPPRIPTRPSRSSQRKRVDQKTHRGHIKNLRGKVEH